MIKYCTTYILETCIECLILFKKVDNLKKGFKIINLSDFIWVRL